MQKEKKTIQLIWGIVLIGAGIGIFFAMPGKMAQLQRAGHTDFFILVTRLCFYLIAVLLIGGGAGKILGKQFKNLGGDQ
jgi:hypothetical protein